MFEGSVDFSMRWTLPVVQDFDGSIAPFEYFLQKGQLPYSYSELPGVHIPDIVWWFSDYLALREVEKWAQKNLKRRTD